MKTSALFPRPDQIAELTRHLDLPLAAVDSVFLDIIAERVTQAFKDIRATATNTVTGGDEAEISALLVTRLNRMIEDDAVLRQLVTCVVRGAESLSYDGSHLEKRPDLSIYLSGRALRFPLIAEAKIIDATRGESLYCSNGIKRFIEGEYGWGGREAFMIAYVRDGTTIAGRLQPYLSQAAQAKNYIVQTAPVALTTCGCDAALSSHGRSFVYSHAIPPANAPGVIALWHLWVDASP